MPSDPLGAYLVRCHQMAREVRAYALTVFVSRLAVGLMFGLSGAFDLKALIMLLMLRDLRRCGPWSQRWIVVMLVMELFDLLLWIAVGVALWRWDIDRLGGFELGGFQGPVLLVLAALFVVWTVVVGLHCGHLLRTHPSHPPGRGFRLALAAVCALALVAGPVHLVRLRGALFSQWREERTQVVAVQGHAVHERVLRIGPPGQERLGLVQLRTAAGPDRPGPVPGAFAVRETTETAFLLGPEDSEEEDWRRVAVGSALWLDPDTGRVEVLREGLDLEWIEMPDHVERLLGDRLPVAADERGTGGDERAADGAAGAGEEAD